MADKKCPFSDKLCGDWCRLFNGTRCVFESIDNWLAALAFNGMDVPLKEKKPRQ